MFVCIKLQVPAASTLTVTPDAADYFNVTQVKAGSIIIRVQIETAGPGKDMLTASLLPGTGTGTALY